MSDSDAYTSDAMSAFQCNVDGMSQPELLKLNRKYTVELTTWDGVVVAYVLWYYFTDDGKVYNWAWSVVYSLSSWVFYNAIKFGDNVIGFYIDWWKLKLTQTPVVGTSPTWWSTVDDYGINPDLTQFQPDVWWSFYCVAVNDSEDVLYFIGKNKVYTMVISQLPLVTTWITLEDNVVWLTRQWWQISIYLQNGRKYFWDWFSEQHDWYVDLGQPIRYVYGNRNYDYVIAGAAAAIYSKLFLSQWQSFQLLRSWQFTLDGITEKRRHAYWMKTPYGNASMASNEKAVFIANEWMNAIESYWNKTTWLPQGSVIEALNEDWADIWAIRFEDNPDILYFSVQDVDGNWSIISISYFKTSTPTYQLSWVYYTKKYVMWAYKNRQTQLVIRKNTPADTQIKVYVSVNGSSAYELLDTISWTDDNIKIASPDNIKVWYEFQYKIELITTNESVTPSFYCGDIFYEQADR